ncbi:putative aquaporin-12A-like [Apostichopus japonicus]|uniref:Putative aquaporin-12A-like n=1 Tax=Stichopus japonicus TaxID=307972 RepID=A0A2G8K6U2_STIJA|nr:putative aquaporin-12A-like [Apostichopus japonicus]
MDIPPVLGTFLLVFFTTTLCRYIRSLLRRLLKDDINIYQYVAEVISTFQLVTGMVEVIRFSKNMASIVGVESFYPRRCFAESLATFLYFLIMVTLQPKGRIRNAVCDASVQVGIILIGLEWTGMMFNPALASALTFNCVNHPLLDHLLVYWVAPMATIPIVQSSFGTIQRFQRQRRGRQG